MMGGREGDTGATPAESATQEGNGGARAHDAVSDAERAMLYHLSPAIDDGQPLPELHAPFWLGPSMLLLDQSGIRAKWEVAAPPSASMVTIFQNVRLVSKIEGMETGRFYCEAWEIAGGIPPAHDYGIPPAHNIVLAADDPRQLDYKRVTISWMENGPAPEHFRLGVDDEGRVTEPWAWAAGANGWRACEFARRQPPP